MEYFDNDNYKLAIKHYKEAIKLNDIYPQTHYNLARVYIKQGQIRQGVLELYKSVEIEPNFVYTYNVLYNIYKASGDQNRSEICKQLIVLVNNNKIQHIKCLQKCFIY